MGMCRASNVARGAWGHLLFRYSLSREILRAVVTLALLQALGQLLLLHFFPSLLSCLW